MQATLYIRSMGKALLVEAVFPDDPQGAQHANAAMEKNSTLAVVAVVDGLIFLASKWDRGVKIEDAHPAPHMIGVVPQDGEPDDPALDIDG